MFMFRPTDSDLQLYVQPHVELLAQFAGRPTVRQSSRSMRRHHPRVTPRYEHRRLHLHLHHAAHAAH